MDMLVGSSGFVGTNLLLKHDFDELYNSANIEGSYGRNPDLLVYAGVPAAMFLANSNPQADMAVIANAVENICKINPGRLVLISTIAVLDDPIGADESVVIDKSKLPAYGFHRLHLEKLARETVKDCHIIRLPALFGKNLKKNFIYDYIHFFPPMLNAAKFSELSAQEPIIKEHYMLETNGFYKLQDNGNHELKAAFERAGFSALNFTDSRSVFQYYNLAKLWTDIETVINHKITIQHMATEPTSAGEVYAYLSGKKFSNELSTPLKYDYRTKNADVFGGKNGYITNKQTILQELKAFVREETAL